MNRQDFDETFLDQGKTIMITREIVNIVSGRSTTDGAGVRIQRSIGATPDKRHDPFLMLDEFYSDNPDDYIAGFPSHPHRGFETVTYMLDGHMRHEDHLGNRGDLAPGDVQWMTAARGIIHSEMPQQSEGRMRGFQLWLNLPAAEKNETGVVPGCRRRGFHRGRDFTYLFQRVTTPFSIFTRVPLKPATSNFHCGQPRCSATANRYK